MSKVYLINGASREPIAGLIAGRVRDALDTDNTFSLTLLGTDAMNVNGSTIIEYDGRYYDVVSNELSREGYTPQAYIVAENVIYRLNQSAYSVKFTTGKYDTVANIMTWALGANSPYFIATPFTFGSTDISGTFSITVNVGTTRRALLQMIADKVGGEIVMNGYSVNIVAHRGSTVPKNLFSELDIKSIRVRTDYREGRVSYDIELFKKYDLQTGDEVHIVFVPLGIDVYTRITAMEYNPYNPYEISIDVGDYEPDIKDLLVK